MSGEAARARNGPIVAAGDTLTIDGGTGEVILGTVATAQADVLPVVDDFQTVQKTWNARAWHGGTISSLAKAVDSGWMKSAFTRPRFLRKTASASCESRFWYDAPTRRRAFDLPPILKSDFLDALR